MRRRRHRPRSCRPNLFLPRRSRRGREKLARLEEGGDFAAEHGQSCATSCCGDGHHCGRLDPGHLRLLGFALMNYPRMLPQITRMATGMTPDNPSFVARWEALLKEVGSWIEEAARHRKALPAR